MRARIPAVECQRLLGQRQDVGDIGLRGVVPTFIDPGERQKAMRPTVVWCEGNRLRQGVDRGAHAVRGMRVQLAQAQKHKTPGVDISPAGHCLLPRHLVDDPSHRRGHHCARDLRLDGEYIVDFPVIGLGPDHDRVVAACEMGHHSDPVPGDPHRTGQKKPDAQLRADRVRRRLCELWMKRGLPRHHQESAVT